jgi:hypothetical protein
VLFADAPDFAIHEVEYNYAGFPLLTEEKLAEYIESPSNVND